MLSILFLWGTPESPIFPSSDMFHALLVVYLCLVCVGVVLAA